MDSEYHQANLERQQQLEEALRRAVNHMATDDDWAVIYYECGLKALQRKTNESYSESRI
jgi:hypothetical protein